MEIFPANSHIEWNTFMKEHSLPVGAFMQTWEWGEFQKALDRKIERYYVVDKRTILAAFTVVHQKLPLQFSYGYIPRGPVLSAYAKEKNLLPKIIWTIRGWADTHAPHFLFLRIEPSVESFPSEVRDAEYHFPSYYIQPKYNLAVHLHNKEEADIIQTFHPSTRSNISRAERRGVVIHKKSDVTENDFKEFLNMSHDTTRRNGGKNVYPSEKYLRSFFASIPIAGNSHDPDKLSLGAYYAYQNDEPAAAHFVLFFGNIATYIYGASYTKNLNSKATTYLHWSAMQDAKKRGMHIYDLGGIDEKRWPTLTNFKRQFRGQEFEYAGNVDIPIRPALHKLYTIARYFKA